MRLQSLLLPLVYGFTCISAATFDYIVVGAGTSGLVIANRLSENPRVTVAVIEPGTDQRSNPNVTEWMKFTQAFGTQVDWAYKTTPQLGAVNQVLNLPQGKAWGGTSTINGMTYIRGNTAQVDAWEDLGNKGWNWASLFPYYKKSENYTIPSATQLAAGATYQSKNHGFGGNVHVGYVAALVNTSTAPTIIQTWENLSLPHNPDLNSGDVYGFGMGPQTIDRALDKRWDSATAYLHPIEQRKNLKILKGTVKRITWAKAPSKQPKHGNSNVADGIEFITDDGKTSFLKVNKEVIVSAGAIRTPLVLEGSGIGNPRILKSLGIETKVDLPGVGENLLEQPQNLLAFSGNLEQTNSAYHTFVTMADIFGSKVSAIEKSTRAQIPKWAQAAVDASGNKALDFKAIKKLLYLQHDLLFKQNVTAAELLTVVASGLLASQFWPLMPFSRGSVHLGNAQKINEPLIDPRFFLAEFDLNTTIATGKYARRFWQSPPASNFVTGPLPLPGPELPLDATEVQWVTWAKTTVGMNAHPLGTASMMSRELGGVVDPELRVYGTTNVRVVDASILPLQISGHLTATLYAVAERASEIIKRTSW